MGCPWPWKRSSPFHREGLKENVCLKYPKNELGIDLIGGNTHHLESGSTALD